MTTTANKIAGMLGNDGSVWEAQDGKTLDEIAAAHGGTHEYEEHDDPILVPGRIVFDDGSAIVYGDAGWDVEGSRPFLMSGLE